MCGIMTSLKRINKAVKRQLNMVVSNGNIVDKYFAFGYTHYLFSLGRSFFEVFYDEIKDKVVWILPCDEDYDLKKFLQKVRLYN
jgi:hypothetical protein